MSETTGSLQVARQGDMEASAEAVWALLRDFNEWNRWHPAILSSDRLEGHPNQPGEVRRLGLGGEATITERLVDYSDADKRYTYIILSGVMPVQQYESTIQVESAGDGKAKITWKGSFDADGVSDTEAIKAIEGVYESGLDALQRRFAR